VERDKLPGFTQYILQQNMGSFAWATVGRITIVMGEKKTGLICHRKPSRFVIGFPVCSKPVLQGCTKFGDSYLGAAEKA